MKTAVLGLGAMGARMARRLVDAGVETAVWNRTAAAAAPFEGQARIAASPAEAAEGADVVIAMVRDDEASRAVWTGPRTGAFAALRPGAVAVESSTLTVGFVRDLAGLAAGRGLGFLDAPVVGSRPQAEAGALIHLVGGEAAELARVEPVLAKLGAARLHIGPAGQGAAVKLLVNTLFGVQVAALAELIDLARAMGLDPGAAFAALGETPVASPAAKGAIGLMLAGRDDPLFPIDLVDKDLGYAMAAGASGPIVAAVAAVFARAKASGLGDRNITAVHRLEP